MLINIKNCINLEKINEFNILLKKIYSYLGSKNNFITCQNITKDLDFLLDNEADLLLQSNIVAIYITKCINNLRLTNHHRFHLQQIKHIYHQIQNIHFILKEADNAGTLLTKNEKICLILNKIKQEDVSYKVISYIDGLNNKNILDNGLEHIEYLYEEKILVIILFVVILLLIFVYFCIKYKSPNVKTVPQLSKYKKQPKLYKFPQLEDDILQELYT